MWLKNLIQNSIPSQFLSTQVWKTNKAKPSRNYKNHRLVHLKHNIASKDENQKLIKLKLEADELVIIVNVFKYSS